VWQLEVRVQTIPSAAIMPPADGDAATTPAGNNSSDFVRKLYKMLEDPSYNSVVRWNAEGDSFVVLEVRLWPGRTASHLGERSD
jgi:hypothetical protein